LCPNPQHPNPQSPIPNPHLFFEILLNEKKRKNKFVLFFN